MRTNQDKAQINMNHPDWLVRPYVSDPNIGRMETYLDRLEAGDGMQSAHCPNMGERFGRGVATFMILGVQRARGDADFAQWKRRTPKNRMPTNRNGLLVLRNH